MPITPPELNYLFNFSLSVCISVSTNMALKTDVKFESDRLFKTSDWNIKENTAAKTTPVPKAISGFVLNKISTITTIGTINK